LNGCGLIFFVALMLLTRALLAAAPTVTSVSPSSGSIDGGQCVTVSGLNFQSPSVTAVTIDGLPVSSFTVIDNTKIDVTLPPHAAGAFPLQVTNADGSNSTPYTYTVNNTAIQVTVRVTIPHYPEIQWGNGTTPDDAGVDHTQAAQRITPYTWIVKDCTSGSNLEVGDSYLSNDSTNLKTIIVENVSRTNAVETITAVASNTTLWTIQPLPGNEQFQVQAQFGANPSQVLDDAAPATLETNLIKGLANAKPLVLQFTMPTQTAAANVGVLQTCTISLIATAN
jgi:hypothetical protein